MTALEVELDACGGADAPATAAARLREVLTDALRRGRAELAKPRSGKHEPVEVGIAAHATSLVAAVPVAASLRADPDIVSERAHDGGAVPTPHNDPDPSLRAARRILQRLDGMGKWGGYHTEFAHLARGFAGNDRALAQEVGEALLVAGLLAEKPSVGQRHVYLNPRRAAEIRKLIDTGEVPAGMRLPSR